MKSIKTTEELLAIINGNDFGVGGWEEVSIHVDAIGKVTSVFRKQVRSKVVGFTLLSAVKHLISESGLDGDVMVIPGETVTFRGYEPTKQVTAQVSRGYLELTIYQTPEPEKTLKHTLSYAQVLKTLIKLQPDHDTTLRFIDLIISDLEEAVENEQ